MARSSQRRTRSPKHSARRASRKGTRRCGRHVHTCTDSPCSFLPAQFRQQRALGIVVFHPHLLTNRILLDDDAVVMASVIDGPGYTANPFKLNSPPATVTSRYMCRRDPVPFRHGRCSTRGCDQPMPFELHHHRLAAGCGQDGQGESNGLKCVTPLVMFGSVASRMFNKRLASPAT